MSGLWEAVDLCLLREGDDSLAGIDDHRHQTPFGDHVVLGSYLDKVMAEKERIAEGEDDDDDVSIPEEVTLFENDHDAASDQDGHGDEVDEGEEESDHEESEEEESGGEWEEDASQCETDDDGQGREEGEDDDGQGREEGEDALHLCAAPLPTGSGRYSQSRHELFLPRGVSPSTEPLQYQEDDDESSDEEEDACSHLMYMVGFGRPRTQRSCASTAACVSSDSSSDGSLPSKAAKRKAPSKAGVVTFSESVTVHPIFETDAYPPSIVERMYTGREELRVNKRRNQREYSHDLNDWRNATEEDEMEANDEGELIHPASLRTKDGGWATVAPPSPCRRGGVVRTYSSAMGGYRSDAGHPGKRMRVSCPLSNKD